MRIVGQRRPSDSELADEECSAGWRRVAPRLIVIFASIVCEFEWTPLNELGRRRLVSLTVRLATDGRMPQCTVKQVGLALSGEFPQASPG
jgi:hypothetical protein